MFRGGLERILDMGPEATSIVDAHPGTSVDSGPNLAVVLAITSVWL